MNMDALLTLDGGDLVTSRPLALFFVGLGFIFITGFLLRMYSLYKRNQRRDRPPTMNSLHFMNILTAPLLVIAYLAISSVELAFNLTADQMYIYGVLFTLVLVAVILFLLSQLFEARREL